MLSDVNDTNSSFDYTTIFRIHVEVLINLRESYSIKPRRSLLNHGEIIELVSFTHTQPHTKVKNAAPNVLLTSSSSRTMAIATQRNEGECNCWAPVKEGSYSCARGRAWAYIQRRLEVVPFGRWTHASFVQSCCHLWDESFLSYMRNDKKHVSC